MNQFNEHNFELAKLAEEDPEIFSITGILVSEKCTAVTNGCMLLEISTPEAIDVEQLSLFGSNFEPAEKFAQFVIPKKEGLEIAKAIALRHDKEEVKRARVGEGDDCTAIINVSDTRCDRTFAVSKIRQNFPDHNAMFEKFVEPVDSVTVNLDFLIPLLQVIAKTTAGSFGSPITIGTRGAEGSLTFEWKNTATGQSVRAALVPMKL